MGKPVGNLNTDPRERLAELAEGREVSLAALSRLIGRNGTYLQQFITKGSPRRLSEDDRRTLAQFFGVGEAELGGSAEKSYEPVRDAVRDGGWAEVPRLPLGASAGPGTLAADELPFDSFRFSTRWLREQGLDPKMLSAIAVAGDSMEPELRDGDEILVDRAPRPFRDGVHVVRMGDALHVKRVQLLRPGYLVLVSTNAAYPPLEVPAGEVEVIGRVVWKGGRL
ncbi:MAG: S24 family peptidase [Candidatus Andeanibacterium colombiense]|uniref:S24 family peptidase n=1 Tax=Candidatus Andeanibacterium colombiense TaxID=3121345 RepID=A0AAJ5X7Y4_9SPHN|nr:MAG: S24 family peptidase [Sphingomonadaceae bacterium]